MKPRQLRTSFEAGETDADGVPIMPAELTLHRFSSTPSPLECNRRRRAWFMEHGIDPGDWNALHPVIVASKRAHAERVGDLPALDRARLRTEGYSANDPVLQVHVRQ